MIAWPQTQTLILAVEIGLLIYGVFVAVTIVLERRRPAATLAWIFILVLLPIVGLVAYVIIGRRKVRQSRRKARQRPAVASQSTAVLARLDRSPSDLGPRAAGLVRLALLRGAAPVRHADAVEILPDPPEVFAALERAIIEARHRIHLEFYIWRDDATGRGLIALLSERARAGVKVRLLVDEIGTLGTPRRHFAPLREAGGEVASFGVLRLRFARPRSRIDFRNHRKVLCVDGELGFVGGVNVGDEYRGVTASGRVWNDLFVRLGGDAVLGLEAMFLDDWLSATDRLVELDADLPPRGAPSPTRTTAPASSGPLVQIVPSGPDQAGAGRQDNNASVIGETFLAAVGTSLARVWIVTPYFIPDEALNQTLQTAALRGVDVKILVPNMADNDLGLVALAARSYYDDLISAGCEIYEYAPGMNHAKYMVIDSMVACIGSANIDVRSLYLNYEVTAIFYDEGVTADLAAVFETDIAKGVLIDPVARGAVGLGGRLAEALARILSPLL